MSQQQINNEYTYSMKHLTANIQEFYKDTLSSYVEDCCLDMLMVFNINDFTYVSKGEVKEWTTKKERYLKLRNMDLRPVIWSVLAQVIYKDTLTFTEVVGKIYQRFEHPTARQNIESAAEVIALMSKQPWFTLIYPNNSETGTIQIQNRVRRSDEVLKYLNNLVFDLPMLCLPEEVESNSDSGYLSFQGSLLSKGKHHDKPLNYGHINRANSTPLKLNADVLLNTKPKWKEKAGETPQERTQRLLNFIDMNEKCVELYAMMEKYAFHLTHKYDERGRTYAKGYHINTQGDDFRKAAIELANKEVIQSH